MSDVGRVFVVTGSASGIGRQLVDDLVARDQRVLATDINIDALSERGWSEDRVVVRRLDVREPHAWREVLGEVVSTFGRLDVVINNAGVVLPGSFHEIEPDEVHRHIDVNAKGVIFGTQAAARIMIGQRRGHIINIGSFAALAPIPGIAVYSASKYAVRAYSLAVAQELRPYGVYVTLVCPESVLTPMLEAEKEYDAASAAFSATRLLTAGEVASLILGRVLRRRPLEAYIPRHRGRLLRLLDLWPRIALRTMPIVRKVGAARQRALRSGGGDEPRT